MAGSATSPNWPPWPKNCPFYPTNEQARLGRTSSAVALGGVMANITGGNHEDHVFRDIGRVIANSFEVAGDQDQVQRRLDGMRIRQHVGEEFAKNLRLQRVQLVVLVENRLRERGVAADERVERVAQHGLRDR